MFYPRPFLHRCYQDGGCEEMKIILLYRRRLLIGICAGFLMFVWIAHPTLRQSSIQVVTSWLAGRIIPIYSVETPANRVSISFDAAWGADHTTNLLAILRKHKVRTTFFLVGFWLEKYPEMVKAIANDGHEIGNHTYTHPHLNSLSTDRIAHELTKNHRLIMELTGQNPKLFRPPFGEYSNKVIETANSCGYVTIIWDVDSLDWKDLSSAEMIRRIGTKIRSGSIILFHNAGKNTPQAVDTLLGQLKQDGYEVVPISELLLNGDTFIDHTGRQRPRNKPPTGDADARHAREGRKENWIFTLLPSLKFGG
jgi:polysaccharide deacetylase family sporulation protein PdaB